LGKPKLRELVVATVVMAFLFGLVLGQLRQPFVKRVGNYGQVITVGCEVYWEDLVTLVDVIDWGVLGYNDTRVFTVYVSCLNNEDSILTVTTNNWVPLEAGTSLVFMAQPNFTVIQPTEILSVDLSIYVPTTKPITNFTDYSFDIIFSATSQ